MATTNLGKVSVTPKGEYDPLITYERLDIISHNGSSYIVKQASTGVTPIDGEFYALIAEKGDGGSFVKKAYKTYAAMDADKVSIPANSSVDVTNDLDESKNGAYIYDGVVFTRSQYDSKVVTDKIIADTASAVQDAINNTAVEGGVLADTFVTATANGVGAVARTQRDVNADVLDIRDYGVVADKTTDWTVKILEVLATLPENSKIHIPMGVKWAATSDPDAVYAAMSDNSILIDDSGYEDRYGTKYWQASQQIYYNTKDYGTAGRGNGNGLNLRSNYHSYVIFEIDAPAGTGGCKGSVSWRFKNSPDGVQFGANGDSLDKAHLGLATYGDYVTGATALKVGLQSSIAPHCWAFNSDLIASATFIFGKHLPTTSTTDSEWKSNPHVTRTIQPSGHTGAFTHVYAIGNSGLFRQDITSTGDLTWVPKTVGVGTLKYSNNNELSGYKKKVVAGVIPTGAALLASSNAFFSNYTAGGGQNITLPTISVGLHFEFSVDVAKNLRVIPSAGTTFIGEATGKYLESAVVGSRLRVTAVGTDAWSVEKIGTWTSEP